MVLRICIFSKLPQVILMATVSTAHTAGSLAVLSGLKKQSQSKHRSKFKSLDFSCKKILNLKNKQAKVEFCFQAISCFRCALYASLVSHVHRARGVSAQLISHTLNVSHANGTGYFLGVADDQYIFSVYTHLLVIQTYTVGINYIQGKRKVFDVQNTMFLN